MAAPAGRGASQLPSRRRKTPPLLSVILPTYNERETIEPLVSRLLEVLAETPTEVIVVDDSSPDGTGAAVERLAAADPRVQLLSRARRQGLASAVFLGVAQAKGRYLCVMDADLSHDPDQVPVMLAKTQEHYDLVIGSRYAPGGHIEGWPLGRRLISRAATMGIRLLFRPPARDVLSGFVLCRRQVLAELPTHHSGSGFKFLVEALVTQPYLRVLEWPIAFRDRQTGRSKATVGEGLELAWLCLRLLLWRGKRRFRGGHTSAR